MIDYIAAGLDLTGLYVIGDKKRSGFIIFAIADLLWIQVACQYEVYGLLLVVVPALILNMRNFIKWRK